MDLYHFLQMAQARDFSPRVYTEERVSCLPPGTHTWVLVDLRRDGRLCATYALAVISWLTVEEAAYELTRMAGCSND